MYEEKAKKDSADSAVVTFIWFLLARYIEVVRTEDMPTCQ